MQTQRSSHTSSAPAPRAEIDFGKGANLTGITALVRSDDKKVVASVPGGTLTLEGDGLVVDSLDADAGSAAVSGDVKSVRKSSSRDAKTALSKLFK